MAFRYVCGLLAAVVAAVGVLHACGTTPPLPPTVGPQPTWAPPASPQCPGYPVVPPVSPPVSPPTWGLAVVDGKLLLETADGTRSTCEKLTILVSGANPVEATVAGKEIRLGTGKEVSGGASLAGTAERVSRGGAGGARLTLEGNATLVCLRKGKKAEISADRVTVDLLTGRLESEMIEAPQIPPSAPASSCPIIPCAPSPGTAPPAPPSTSLPPLPVAQ